MASPRTQRKRRWYAAPIALLSVGVVIAALVLWSIVDRPSGRNSVNDGRTSDTPRSAYCGDGICDNVACLSTNCPPAESSLSCPQDCPTEMQDGVAPGSNLNASNGNVNANRPPFTVAAQTDEQTVICPIADANLQAADAVSIAKKSGLTDGIADVSVSYYNYGPPIEQCVWDVKNFLERESGTSVIIIDSTQEVFEKKTWRRSS